MATGIVVGLSKYRDTWHTDTRQSDAASPSSSYQDIRIPAMNPSGHHRSYSDAPESLSRLRLPPISNLIGDATRQDPPYRPAYHDTQIQAPFKTSVPQGRPSLPSETMSWSPSNDARPPFQIDHHYQQQPQQQYDHRTGRDASYIHGDYHRSYVMSQMPDVDGGHTLPQVLHQQSSDPLSPNARTTAKSVVREEILPGKGLCYVYDDGSVCQKVINGDTVNPKWGTTKAGKPRKRLGQACNTCREKKIKCDPSFPKCTQCQKFGRECRFEAPTRIANKSPKMRTGGSPSANSIADDTTRPRRPSLALTEASSHSESGTISSRAAGTADENLSPLTNDSNFPSDVPGPFKKARLTQMDSETLPVHRPHTQAYDLDHAFALEVDPFRVNKKLTETYLSAYFTHINDSFFSLVPEQLFLKWAAGAEDKTQASKLVLYCMLALGCSFSKSSDRASHGRIFASIALEGVMQSFGYYSIQLIQARVIFGLYEFQCGREERAWDLCGAAVRTACAMKLNTEEGIAQHLREKNTVYGLDEARMAECMRRTFWAAYTMDNLGVACLCITTTFSKADCFLRLPSTDQAFAAGVLPRTPVFDGEVTSIKSGDGSEHLNVGSLGYLVQIASLCCDVRVSAFRANHHINHNRQKRQGTARDDLETQLRAWNENYLGYINRKAATRSGLHEENTLSFGGLHLLYHYSCMQLHRHIPHARLSRTQVSEHIQLAYHHAEKTLAIAEQVTKSKSQDIRDHDFAVGSPISGYAVHYAIDILSAAGVNAKVLENQSPILGLIMNSVQLLDNLADVWTNAKMHKKQVSDRVRLVFNSANAGMAEGKIGFCIEEPMVTTLDKEEDLVYGVDRMQYIKSLGWSEQIHSPSDLNVVSGKGKGGLYSIWKD